MGHKYEFFGPPGAFTITISITIITYLTHFLITPAGTPPREFLSSPLTYLSDAISSSDLFDFPTLLLYLSYFLLTVTLQYVLPGTHAHGVLLSNNTRLTYKLNASASFVTILSLLAFFTFLRGPTWSLWLFLWEHNLHLVTTLNLFAFTLSTALYLYSLRPGTHLLAAGGQTNTPLYDWFIGRELNPRPPFFSSLDLKSFCELRPGLTLWTILNLSNIAAQYRLHGYITDSIVLITLFQFWYVLDSYLHEPAVLTTMDITTDGFGHMLVFGDLAWVPLTYSIQTRYLAYNPVRLGPWGILAVLLVHITGYAIFRLSNSQKNAFRTNPNSPSVSHLKSMPTKRGTKLIISGWWGMARHINYFGDWIMAWAWCLPTAFGTPLTYFYVVYFAILLIHRDRRDDAACKKKYGEDWEKYKRLVKWRIVPGVY